MEVIPQPLIVSSEAERVAFLRQVSDAIVASTQRVTMPEQRPAQLRPALQLRSGGRMIEFAILLAITLASGLGVTFGVLGITAWLQRRYGLL